MKRKTLFFLLGLLCIVPLSLRAERILIGDLYYEIDTETFQASFTRFVGSIDGNVTVNIPATITCEGQSYAVTSIGRQAFYECPSVGSVTIPESVTSIGEEAFVACGVVSLTIPDGVTSIGDRAFEGVYNIIYHGSATGSPWGALNVNAYVEGYLIFESEAKTQILKCTRDATGEIVIPNTVTSIGASAFYWCSALTSITIPESVTSIGASAFDHCSGLTSITIPENVTSIGASAFDHCSGLTSITIPENVTSIGASAFSYCSGLTTITIPDGVTSIGNNAFYNVLNIIYHGSATGSPWGAVCVNGYMEGYLLFESEAKTQVVRCSRGATGEIVIPNTVTSIGNSAFSSCSGLTTITIPESVTSIGNSAFYNCTGLTSITIPESVTSIGNSAFSGCSGLTTITIPDGVTSIGNNAFSGILNVIYHGSATGSPWGASCVNGYVEGNLVFESEAKTQVVRCARNATGEIVIPNTVTSIGDYAFSGCLGITSITIPESVTNIGNSAFSDCLGLTSVTIPESVTSIGDMAFAGCVALTSIILPNSVTSLGEAVFYQCSGLTSVTLPEGITSIGYQSFIRCYSLVSITIPESVTSIGNSAFYNCSGLTSITIPESVTSIGSSAFSECTSLTTITIPENVTSIGNSAFSSCSGLTSVIWNAQNCADFSSYSNTLFYSYYSSLNITSFIFGDGVEHIPAYLCYGLKNLNSITISNSVTSIGKQAFSGCSGLSRVDYTGTLAEWCAIQFGLYDSNPIYYSDNLYINDVNVTEGVLNIPYGVTSIGNYAFYGCRGLTSLTISESVTSIGANAFYNCSGLPSVVIPESVTSIGSNAFYNVLNIIYNGSATGSPWGALYVNGYVEGNLVFESEAKTQVVRCLPAATGEIVIPNTVTSIGEDAFSDCSRITSIAIPNTVTSIGTGAFYDCDGLSRVDYTGTLAEWCAIQFSQFNSNPLYCARNLYIDNVNVTKGVLTIPDGVTTIGSYAFTHCDSITSLAFPSDLTEIGYGAFDNCAGLTSLTIPDNITAVGGFAFNNCSNLTSVTWNAKRCDDFNMYQYPFNQCSAIASFTLGDGVEHIPSYLYYGRSGITSITIPASVTSIGYLVLGNCPVEYIISLMEAPASLGDNMIGSSRSPQNVSLIVPQSSISQYQTATYWKDFAIKTQTFCIHSGTTQTTAKVEAAYITADSEAYDRLGYVFDGDTIWNNDASLDSVLFTLTGLAPSTDYEFCLVADGVLTDEEIEDISDPCDGSQWSEWSRQNSYWTSDGQYYHLSSSTWDRSDYLYRTVTLDSGVVYTFSIDAWRSYYYSSGSSLTMSVGDGGQYTTLLNVSSLTTSATAYSATFTPTETKEYTLRLYGVLGTSSGSVYVNNISVTHTLWETGVYSQCASFKTQAVQFNVSASTTQTTARVSLGIDCGDVPAIERCGFTYYQSGQSDIVDTVFFVSTELVATMDTLLAGLPFNTTYRVTPFVDIEGQRYFHGTYTKFSTKNISATISTTTTQTTARVSLGIDCGDVPAIERCGFTYYNSNQSDVVDTVFFASTEPIATLDTLLTGLLPNTYYYATPFVDIEGARYYGNYGYAVTFTTQSISASLTLGAKTQSTISLTWSFNYGDAGGLNSGINGIEYCEGSSFSSATKIDTIHINSELSTLSLDTIIRGLKYGTTYYFRPYVVTTSGERIYGTTRNTTTSSISWDVSVLNATQTTASLHLTHDFGDAAIDYLSCKAIGYTDTISFNLYCQEPQGEIDTVLTHLHPNTYYKLLVYTMQGGAVVGSPLSTTFTTQPVSVGTPSVVEYGQTYAVVNSSWDYGDATMVRNVLEFKLSAEDDAEISTTTNITGTQTKVTNLLPDTTYYFRHVLEIEEVPAHGKSYDFENAEDNAHWHFINDTQTNQWVIGQEAGSNGAGSSTLYVSSDGASYSYANTTSTVWAYCDEVLSGTVMISFDWKGTGESKYDYMYAYLVPVSADQPAAGTTTVPTGAIQIGSRFSAQSSWTTFTDETHTLTEQHYLYFMWHNDGSTAGSPIAIDNINMGVLSGTSDGTLTTDWQEFSTKAIALTTQPADGISNTSALLHGTIDCDQESYTEVGFEWKYNDAPENYKPQRLLVTDRVDENLFFRLEGLDSRTWYDFRTFCSYSGETYYGEWEVFRTTSDAVVVAPTVQTVGAEITEQGVEMEGFVVAGTEPMLQQGFEVWVKGTTNVLTTVAEGTIMHAYIPEVRSYTAYQYRAYAKTAAGTTYGATLEIETGYIKQNVQDVTVTPSVTEATITWTVVEDAAYYLLTLFADEAQTDTIGIYEVGTDGVITRRNKPGTVQSLVNCLVEELEPDTEYFFSVIAYNAADQKVAEETGWFATELPTSLVFTTDEENSASAPIVRKILYRGQVLILRDGKAYNLFGQEVR